MGGYTEAIPLEDARLVYNEEDKPMGLPGDRRLGSDIIAGTFFLARDAPGRHFCSLTQKQANCWGQHFAQLEVFQPDEVERKIHTEFYTMQAVIPQPVSIDTDISSADVGAGYNHK